MREYRRVSIILSLFPFLSTVSHFHLSLLPGYYLHPSLLPGYYLHLSLLPGYGTCGECAVASVVADEHG